MENHILHIKGLKKSFGANRVLDGIDLALSEKEHVSILGYSGIGKSVLLKCIVRLIEPDEGVISLLGQNVNELTDSELNRLRINTGYVFQNGALYDSMTVRDNLIFPVIRTKNIHNQLIEVEERVHHVLNSVGLIDAIDKMPAELSGGMMKRIGLARALMLRPSVIFYDEPTTGLDPVTAGEITNLILKIREEYQASAIVVSHDMECVKKINGEIKLLKDGVFYASGSYDSLKNDPDPFVHDFFN